MNPCSGEAVRSITSRKEERRSSSDGRETESGLLHVPSHQQEEIVDVREDEEEEDGAEEHGHPGAMILPEHFQPQVST